MIKVRYHKVLKLNQCMKQVSYLIKSDDLHHGSLTVAGPLILKNVDYNVIFLSNFLF